MKERHKSYILFVEVLLLVGNRNQTVFVGGMQNQGRFVCLSLGDNTRLYSDRECLIGGREKDDAWKKVGQLQYQHP